MSADTEIKGGVPHEVLLPYQDVSLSIATRVADLVSRMTLAEKVSQMVYDAAAIERLDIPEYNWWNECLHGVGRAGIATVFPQAIGLAATWNVDLMSRVGTAIANEARAKHHEAVRRGVRQIYSGLTFWSPNVNIFRDPRWGRGQETYGEDPYLTARMGVAFVEALQGDDPHYLKVVATPKHFVVHSGPEGLRHRFDARVSPQELWNTYLPAFEACVVEGRACSVMGAYNRVNGEPCCASPTLLGGILRGKWGFEGYVVSDCWAIRDIYQDHGVVDTPAEAAALAVREGCDLNCGVTYAALLEAVERGLISEEMITRAVERLFTARFKLGMFDPPEQVPYARIPYDVNDSESHRQLALQAARESIVLLKNADKVLPLRKDLASIAVIGPNADDLHVLLGNYNGTPLRAVTPLEGIRTKVSDETKLYYARGCNLAEGIPTLDVIAPVYLRPVDPASGQRGLSASYYENGSWAGDPSVIRVDSTVDFAWKDVFAGQLSVRWTGFLVPPVSGIYTLGVRGMSGYSLYLNGSKVLEHHGMHHPVLKTGEVELQAGRLYHIQLDYQSLWFDPQVQLLWSMPGVDFLAQALDVARAAGVIVAVVGLSPLLEGEEMPVAVPGFDRGDRTDIVLPRTQEELLRQLGELGKPLIVVLLNGSALAVPWADENADAILEAWYPGEEGGTAIADVLFGDHNPAGRLPITFYASVDDLPPFDDYRMEGRTYRYFRGQPLYAFGYGLSYTTFKYDNLCLSASVISPDDPVKITVDVTNTGDCPGDEVVQLYVTDVAASSSTPKRELQGFRRVHLAPGETETVEFALQPRQMALVDEDGRRIIEPGAFQVAVGGRQPTLNDVLGTPTDIVIDTFTVSGQTTELS
ncbi:MAG: glucan 1,4-alpha-glucosidase [Chloroflexi bacterium]|nr:glucan 1,4-alpha-glucosidase [Chloroflexota bacterium]